MKSTQGSILIKRKKEFSIIMFFVFLFCFINLFAQENTTKSDVYVDDNGVMRWGNSNEEVQGFGVNYTVPFAHAYRSAKRLGIDPKKEIDNDVYHFSRLGFDLYRIHVWDTEISDSLGNLIENEHLDAFDYLLKKLIDKDINFVITPIAFWGNGWPERDEDTPGFSHKYGKGNSLTNPDAIKAQHNYLEQFLNHINPYTGVAYKDEPNMIAFEVSNEPHHRGEAKIVTTFVKGMTGAMRKTGTKKPIFYNMSHGVHFADAYFKGNVQGGTFQWYPTGLGYQRELSGNFLPNVNDYNITFDKTIKSYKGAKMVYEFDAADVGKSYIYPAMARSFREAGIQIATHFAYDPTFLSYANTEYNTHYMNLSYTPQKALSLKICSEIFHEIPLYSNSGIYPQNTTFGNFKVDYENDLAEYNSEEKFFYTNTTNSVPKNENNLKEIAGSGNSYIAKYNGTGAYFIDKIATGMWRLEVMPDALWVSNPFGRNSLKKTVGVIKWEAHDMTINLKDLGNDFSIIAIDDDNDFSVTVTNTSFIIKPGVYIVSKKGGQKNWSPDDVFGMNKLKDFYAPKTTVDQLWFKHQEINEVTENSEFTLTAQFIAATEPKQIQIVGFLGSQRIAYDMIKTSAYNYTATIPSDKVVKGFFNYNIIVKIDEDNFITYPSANEGRPFEWDFYDRSTYKITVVPKSNPIYLFNANEDTNLLVRQWRNTFKLVPTENKGEAEYHINLEKLFYPDNENLNAKPIYDYSFKHFIIDKITGRETDLSSKSIIVFYGRALNDKPCKLQIAFVMDDGSSFGKVIEIGTELKEYKLSINELQPVKTVTLPRPYPTFLPYYFEHNINSEFNINKIESLQFSIGPEVPHKEREDMHGISMISLRLE
ncbi:MAG: hypothetical protein DRI75_05360 [Bacteroidetes bacterium]|nr:MAG: hypothetical protein DRI75_05360 [Bacteroidota bacterium]